ncbi:MAG: leucine-rich repeat domain-containing protein [Clostridia bacterium]
MLKNKKGITLIALVVTIVVLLILAGVSINLVLDNNGIIAKSKDARNSAIESDEKEKVEMAYVSAALKKLGDTVTAEELQEELDSSVGTGKTDVTTNGDDTLNVLFSDTEHNFNVDEGKVEKAKPITNNYGEDWEVAWTYTNGVWSNQINKGEKAEGDVVAKFYKTGNRVKPDGFTWRDTGDVFTFEEGDEYRLVVEGNGPIGDLGTAEGTNITSAFAWFLQSAMYMKGATDTCIMPYVKELVICNGITSIGNYAFCGASSLEKLSIANTVTNIGDYAFLYDVNLANVKLPNKIENIGYTAFNETKIQNITIPNSVKKLSGAIFANCGNLARIKFLPTDMTGIDVNKSIFYDIENCTIYVKNEIVKNYMEQNLNIPSTVNIEILE